LSGQDRRGIMRQEAISGRLRRLVAGRVAIALIVLLILILVAPSLSFIEVRGLDFLYGLRAPRQPNPHIEIIDIGGDPGAYERLRDPRDLPGSGCEIPRRAYAEAVRRLSRWGARAIVFDMMFSRSCRYEDAQLAEAMRQAGNVVVAASAKTKPGAVGLQDPVAPIDKAVWGVGSPVAHQPNETVRSIPLVVSDRDTGREYLALSLVAFQCFAGAKPSQMRISDGWLETAGLRVPVLSGERISLLNPGGSSDDTGSTGDSSSAISVVSGSNVKQIRGPDTWNALLVNWVGGQGTIRPRLLSDLLALDDKQGRALFAGKAVIIGRTDWDVHWTAMGSMPGVEIQANALQTLMDGAFIRPISAWGIVGLLVATSLATAAAVRRFAGIRGVGAVLVLAALSVFIARQFLVERGIWTYPFYCALGMLLTWGMMTVAESDKVTNLLTRFIPSFIGKPETKVTTEIRSMEASILFSDIRGYTGTAEQLSAEDTMTILNIYHGAVEDIVTSYGGTIVKTPGDAVLVVFWKDVGPLNHATCALLCGKEILEHLPTMAPAWEALGVNLDVGVGINTGRVAMGLVGKRHLEPTVIGDPVNVAQRLETLTKTLQRPLIFSESVHELLREDIDTVYLDEVTVTGRKTPLRIYTIAGLEDPSEGSE